MYFLKNRHCQNYISEDQNLRRVKYMHNSVGVLNLASHCEGNGINGTCVCVCYWMTLSTAYITQHWQQMNKWVWSTTATILTDKNSGTWKKSCPSTTSVNHKTHKNWPGVKSGPQVRQAERMEVYLYAPNVFMCEDLQNQFHKNCWLILCNYTS